MENEMTFSTHGNLPREAPGSSVSTRQAFSLLKGLPDSPKILDVGCGPGAAALDLAEVSKGNIVAVDVNQPFLDELNSRAQKRGLSARIQTSKQSMFEMDFPPKTFDVVWSEGAIYIMGFEKGLRAWKQFLKPNGYLVLTELSWLSEKMSDEPHAFWKQNYPGMQTVEQNIRTLEECGFAVQDHFALPESAWWDEYYQPWEKKLLTLKEEHSANPKAIQHIEEDLQEINLYRKFHDEYGYVFYIARLRD